MVQAEEPSSRTRESNHESSGESFNIMAGQHHEARAARRRILRGEACESKHALERGLRDHHWRGRDRWTGATTRTVSDGSGPEKEDCARVGTVAREM